MSAASPASTRARWGALAVVAGASEGLGAAFAEALAARGHDLLLVARGAEKLEALAARLAATHGVATTPLVVDLDAEDAAAHILAAVGTAEVGVLVNNAAVAPLGGFLELPLADAERALRVNCRSTLRLVHALAPGMVARGRGAVVILSSLTAFQGSPWTTVYGATKSFALSFAEGLWAELAPHGVEVIACAAGATRTPNYLAHAALGGAPGELEPAQVVEETLAALGHGPLVIPGRFNRFASFLMRRLLPRAGTVRIMAAQTRKLRG